MKKFILGIAFALAVLTSCSKDDDPAPVPAITISGDYMYVNIESNTCFGIEFTNDGKFDAVLITDSESVNKDDLGKGTYKIEGSNITLKTTEGNLTETVTGTISTDKNSVTIEGVTLTKYTPSFISGTYSYTDTATEAASSCVFTTDGKATANFYIDGVLWSYTGMVYAINGDKVILFGVIDGKYDLSIGIISANKETIAFGNLTLTKE